MTATTQIKLKPFAVPVDAVMELPARPKQDGLKMLPRIPLEDLEPDALDALAQTWLDNLYASVKRRSPFYLTPKAAPHAGSM